MSTTESDEIAVQEIFDGDGLSVGGMSPVVTMPPTVRSSSSWDVMGSDVLDLEDHPPLQNNKTNHSDEQDDEDDEEDVDDLDVARFNEPHNVSISSPAKYQQRDDDPERMFEDEQNKVKMEVKEVDAEGPDRNEHNFFLETSTTRQDDELEMELKWPRKMRTKIMVGVLLAGTVEGLVNASFFSSMDVIAETFQTGILPLAFTAALFAMCMGVFPFVWGPLSDWYSRRWMVIFGLVASSVISFALSLSWGIAPIIAGRSLQGICLSSVFVVSSRIISDTTPILDRGFTFAALSAARLLGPIVGYLIGGFVTEIIGWRMAFVLTGLSGLAKAGVFYASVPETLNKEGWQATKYDPFRSLKLTARKRSVVASCLMSSVAIGSIYLSIFLTATHLSVFYRFQPALIGVLLAVIGVAAFIGLITGRILTGVISRRWTFHGSRMVLPVASVILTSFGQFLFGWIAEQDESFAIFLLVVSTFCFFMSAHGCDTWIIDQFPPDRSGHVLSASNGYQWVAIFAFQLVGSIVFDLTCLSLVFSVSSFFVLVSAVLAGAVIFLEYKAKQQTTIGLSHPF